MQVLSIYACLRLFTGLLLYNTVVANGKYHFLLFASTVVVDSVVFVTI